MNDPGGAGVDPLDDRRGEICRKRWLQALVGDHSQRSLLAGAGDHTLHEVPSLAHAPMQPVQTPGSDHQRSLAVTERGVFASKLRERVYRSRRRMVVLRIWLRPLAVEHVVG